MYIYITYDVDKKYQTADFLRLEIYEFITKTK